MNKNTKEYESPVVEVCDFLTASSICQSSNADVFGDGDGNLSVDYINWEE